MTFVYNGILEIGYQINSKANYVWKLQNGILGDYQLTFNKRSHFDYRVVTHCQAFFIRRLNWKKILEDRDHPDIIRMYKEKLLKGYNTLKNTIMQMKSDKMKAIAKRYDYECISSMQFVDDKKLSPDTPVHPQLHFPHEKKLTKLERQEQHDHHECDVREEIKDLI